MIGQFCNNISRLRSPGRGILGGALALAFGWLSCAQFPASGEPVEGPVRLRIHRVSAERFPEARLILSVDNADGSSVLGLSRRNFALTEEGRTPADLSVVSELPAGERIAVALVLDRSRSMRGRPLDEARAAAEDFAHSLSQEDEFSVVTFASRTDIVAPLTTDKAAALRPLERARASGGTALYDTIVSSVNRIGGSDASRKAVIALTDGYDNASGTSVDACIAAAQRTGVPIYVIGLGGASQKVLSTLAAETGGAFFAAHDPDELRGIYQTIAGSLRNLYVVSYTSPDMSPRVPWRTVEVTVTVGGDSGSNKRQFVIPARGAGDGEDLIHGNVPWVAVVSGLLIVDAALLAWALVRRSRRRRMRDSEW